MEYIAKTQRGVLGSLLLLMILTISISDFSNWLIYVQLIWSLFILSSLFIKYKFKINDDHLTYQIVLFRLPLYKRSIHLNQINQIRFKRFGWYTKGAIIQVDNGINIRIVHFVPDEVLKDLVEFARKNGISYSKTKDYCILEK
ncbi:hypothetical protein [Anaerosporobacter sp.]